MRQSGRVDLVHLVCFVHLVCLVQPNKPNRPNKQEKQAGFRVSRAIVCGAWEKVCPWAKRLSWQTQGGRVRRPTISAFCESGWAGLLRWASGWPRGRRTERGSRLQRSTRSTHETGVRLFRLPYAIHAPNIAPMIMLSMSRIYLYQPSGPMSTLALNA